MRFRCFCISVLLFLATGICPALGQKLDSTVAARLDHRLSEYFAALERESLEVKKGECDFLIETCVDSLIRQYVAIDVYEHFRDSKVMGDEAVAIHVLDRWFLSGKVSMHDDLELLAAKVYAEFNRRSLIGETAPEMLLYDMDEMPVSVFGDSHSGRYSVLYFYDTSCAACKIQTILLRNILQDADFPIDFYAVYASDDKHAWVDYVENQLSFNHVRMEVQHLWDPQLNSDFQRKYGVIQTPRLLLVDPDGVIVGRGLDANALGVMLHAVFDEVSLEYGSDESLALYDGIFGGQAASLKDVSDVADYIAQSTLAERDTVMFRQMTGDMLYYLSLQTGEGFKEGLDYLIDNYILSRGDVWKSSDDSLKIVGMARLYDDMLSRSTPGKMVPALELSGTLLSFRKSVSGEFRLNNLRGKENYIMFVTDGCEVCAAEKAAAKLLVKTDRRIRILIVNVDELIAADEDLASEVLDSFDLASLPFIIKTDKKGRILRRYISFLA